MIVTSGNSATRNCASEISLILRNITHGSCPVRSATLKCDINDNSPHIDKKMIVGGDYIRIRHHGSDDGLHETLDKIYDYILRQNNITIINQPCIFHYIDDQEITAEKDCRTDIYVGIKA